MEKSKKNLKIFISGPMTGYPNWNKEAFDRAEKRLRELGYDVFNPSWMRFTEGWSHEEIMAIDLAALEKCDAIAQLDGWQESIGAQEEFEQAKRLNKKIFMFVSEYGDLVEINYARRVIDEMGQFYKEAMDFINAGLSKIPDTLVIDRKKLLRPCIVDDRKELFHGWYLHAEVVEPSIMVGGHMGGQLATTLGIVEFENGEIQLIGPTSIKFIGSRRLMQEYCFEEDKR